MLKTTYIFLFSLVAFASSLPQITYQGRVVEPGLSISQQIGDGIRNVPIPPPWYFLRNKYYWNANTGFKGTTERSGFVNNYLNNGQVNNGGSWSTNSPDLVSKFNTINPNPTTAKIEYTYSTSPPVYQVPNTWTPYSPAITTTEGAKLTNAHSRPIYNSQYPNNVSTTEIPKLPTSTSTIESVTDNKVAENSGVDKTTAPPLIDSQNISTTIIPPSSNDTSASEDTASLNNNPGLLFSGPQICKKRNAYFGVGENHSFYVECQDFQPAVKLCQENYSFDSNVQWPEHPCKKIPIENQK